jgi:hypothetical protein
VKAVLKLHAARVILEQNKIFPIKIKYGLNTKTTLTDTKD